MRPETAAVLFVAAFLLVLPPGACAASPHRVRDRLVRAEVSSDGSVTARVGALLRREPDTREAPNHEGFSLGEGDLAAVLLSELHAGAFEVKGAAAGGAGQEYTATSRNDSSPTAPPGSGKAKARALNCNMTEEMCCNPKAFQDAYLACMDDNCRVIEEAPQMCDDLGMCTKACSMNCCCLFKRTFDFIAKSVKSIKDSLVKLIVMLLALQKGLAKNAEELPETREVESVDPNEAAKYTADVILDVLKIALGTPTAALILVMIHARMKEFFSRAWKSLFKKEESVRTDHLTAEEKENLEKNPEFREKAELETYISQMEQDRLGGIANYTITKVSGLSGFWWFLTNSLGVAFFYVLMASPVQISVCTLGMSGRMMVLSRTPLLSAIAAAKMFIGLGTSTIGFAIVLHVFLRSTERSVLQARVSEDPQVRAAIAQDHGSQFVVGKVHLFTVAFIVAQWFFWVAVMKTRIRDWGYNDERNFYESKEASVAQYFRTGVRGAVPGLSKRFRKGGMRLFFGPYPESALFKHLGREYAVLKNLDPMLVLPTESSNAYPPSGNGMPRSPEDQAGIAQLVLGLLNALLGTLGIVFFAIHMYNLLTNLQNCPIGSVVSPCVAGVDCTNVAKTPWFQHYLLMNYLRSPDQIVQDQLMPSVKINTVGLWLGTDTVEETTAKVLNISRQACAERVVELFDDPNSSIFSATADSVGKMDAANYLGAYEKHGLNVRWDDASLGCQDCAKAIMLKYFTGIDNIIELVEIAMLMLTVYASFVVYNLLYHKLANCPMIDLPFQSNPGSSNDINVDKVEKACLHMIGFAFDFRYKYSGVPEQIERLEKEIRLTERKETTTEKLPDPWLYNTKAKTWDEYDLLSKTNARLFYVSKDLLGILEGEEVVTAWSEAPRLSWTQCIIIFGGFLFLSVFPGAFAIYTEKPLCFVEACVTTAIHYYLCDYFILRRRPQAGFVLTSRRFFQVTRRPAYYDVFGRVEPLIKMDVLVHDCGLTYSSMTMEAHVPLWRRAIGSLLGLQFFRRGQVIVQGSRGIFKFWRIIGDTREAFEQMSRVHYMEKVMNLSPHEGKECMDKEKAEGVGELPDPICSCCCCPYTPPPTAMKGATTLDRYAVRFKGEKDVYSRKLAIRPSTCGELCCGRGCVCECSCCCCCQLEELLTEAHISTHRIIVEQRAVQRYCRFFQCCRATPNIRITMLAHIKASAYLREQPARAFGLNKLRTDLCMKLLHTGGREYAAGLMLHQQPYQILRKRDLPLVDKLWVEHICKFYDYITQKEDMADDSATASEVSESEGDDFEDYGARMDDDSDVNTPPGSEDGGKKGEKGKGGRKGKGKGKGKAKGEGKSKGKSSGEEGAAPASDGEGQKSPGLGKAGKDKGKGKSKGKDKSGAGKESGRDAEGDEQQGESRGALPSSSSTGKAGGKGEDYVFLKGAEKGKGEGKGKGKSKGKAKSGKEEALQPDEGISPE